MSVTQIIHVGERNSGNGVHGAADVRVLDNRAAAVTLIANRCQAVGYGINCMTEREGIIRPIYGPCGTGVIRNNSLARLLASICSVNTYVLVCRGVR